MLPLLKHSLAVWQAVRGQRQLEQAISNMAACNTEFSIDNWSVSLIIQQQCDDMHHTTYSLVSTCICTVVV